jgi:hypothetical protein
LDIAMRILLGLGSGSVICAALWFGQPPRDGEKLQPLIMEYPALDKLLAIEPDVQTWLQEQKDEKVITRIRTVKANHKVLQKRLQEDVPLELSLDLFDKKYVLELRAARSKGSGAGGVESQTAESQFIWTGHIKDVKGSSATVTCSGTSVFADMRTLDEVYEIRPAPEWKKHKDAPLHVLIQVNEAAFPPDRSVVPEKKNAR